MTVSHLSGRSDDKWETPSSTRFLISVIEASPFSQEAWILGKINININIQLDFDSWKLSAEGAVSLL